MANESTSWPIKYLKPTHTLGDNNQRQAHDDVNKCHHHGNSINPQNTEQNETDEWEPWWKMEEQPNQQEQQTQTATEDKKGPEGTGLT